MADPTSAVNTHGTLAAYAGVARMLDEVAACLVPKCVLLTFDDFLPDPKPGGGPTTDAVPRPSPCADSGGGMMTILTARPKPPTAAKCADRGGYAKRLCHRRLLDLAGFDVSNYRPVINIQTAVTAARAAGMLIICFKMAGMNRRRGWRPRSPNFHKSNALKTMRKQPQLQGKLLAKGSRLPTGG